MRKLTETPVLVVAFNRPEITRRLWMQLRKLAPSRLFVAIDGPRHNTLSDIIRCKEVQQITSDISWPCKVDYLINDINSGCDTFVPRSITWAFEDVDRLIILEDDCIPGDDFFEFSTHILNTYCQNRGIAGCSGNNLGIPRLSDLKTQTSYLFSRYSLIWGWGTWKDVWSEFVDFDFTTADLDWLKPLPNRLSRTFWLRKFQEAANLNWDYKWMMFNMIHARLCAIPTRNLVANIGLHSDATHPYRGIAPDRYSAIEGLLKPLISPSEFQSEDDIDDKIEWDFFSGVEVRRLSVAYQRMSGLDRD